MDIQHLPGLLIMSVFGILAFVQVFEGLRFGRVTSFQKHDSRTVLFDHEPFAFLFHMTAWGSTASAIVFFATRTILERLQVGGAPGLAALTIGGIWALLMLCVVVTRDAAEPARSSPMPTTRDHTPRGPRHLVAGIERLAHELGARLSPLSSRLMTDFDGRLVSVEVQPGPAQTSPMVLNLSLELPADLPHFDLTPNDLHATRRLPAHLRPAGVEQAARRLLDRPGANLLRVGRTLRMTFRLTSAQWRPIMNTQPESIADPAERSARALRAILDDMRSLGSALVAAYAPSAQHTVQLQPRRAPEGTRCPYCRDEVVDDLRICPECQTAHHNECWTEGGGCTVLGCSARRPQRRRTR